MFITAKTNVIQQKATASHELKQKINVSANTLVTVVGPHVKINGICSDVGNGGKNHLYTNQLKCKHF